MHMYITALNLFPTRDFIVTKVFLSTQNVKSENFMQGEGREEEFLNIRLR